ncbi:MAG: hypothetical protein PHV32_01840 [Eubacteriales bacterium]|nr:hypothetical protein [Eubacteriales bacterium]
MKNYIIFGIVCLAVVVCVCGIIAILSNPLRKSNEHIRKDLLKSAPIGTSMEDVLTVIGENKNWKILQYEGRYKPWPPDSDDEKSLITDSFIRSKEIKVLLGEYIAFLPRIVYADFLFDEDLNLIDIVVNKGMDLP